LAPLPGFQPAAIRGIELRSGSRVDLQPFSLRVAPIPERQVPMMPSPFGRNRDPFGPGQEYDITADRQTRQGAIVQYRGNVRMHTYGTEVTADELDFDLMTRTGDARGNVRVRVLPLEFKVVPLTRR
jgi:lipopolysaccharide assembly outer membrane protein LptD (OstA)